MLCQEMNDFHFLSQESCMTGAFACFQSGLRTCFAITYLRFITLLVENVLLWLAVDQLSLSLIGSKLIVSVVTVIGNYALCKYRVFKTAAHGQDQNMIRKELLPYDNQK